MLDVFGAALRSVAGPGRPVLPGPGSSGTDLAPHPCLIRSLSAFRGDPSTVLPTSDGHPGGRRPRSPLGLEDIRDDAAGRELRTRHMRRSPHGNARKSPPASESRRLEASVRVPLPERWELPDMFVMQVTSPPVRITSAILGGSPTCESRVGDLYDDGPKPQRRKARAGEPGRHRR